MKKYRLIEAHFAYNIKQKQLHVYINLIVHVVRTDCSYESPYMWCNVHLKSV